MRSFLLAIVCLAFGGCITNQADTPPTEAPEVDPMSDSAEPDVTISLVVENPEPRMAAGTDCYEAGRFLLVAGPRGATIRCLTGQFAFSFNDPANSYTLELVRLDQPDAPPLGQSHTVGGFAIQYLSVEAPEEGVPLITLSPRERVRIAGNACGLAAVAPDNFMMLTAWFIFGFEGDDLAVEGLPVRSEPVYIQ